jgi:hypothetical protein
VLCGVEYCRQRRRRIAVSLAGYGERRRRVNWADGRIADSVDRTSSWQPPRLRQKSLA